MRILSTLLIILCLGIHSYAQESTSVYSQALDVIKNSLEYKQLNIERHTLSKESISFTNSAYAFWLEDPDLKFTDIDFKNYFGEFYQPIEINAFESLRVKRRAKHILFVSETVDDYFIIELLLFKRKRRSKYPKFYQGTSYSFLFKKKDTTNVKYIRTIKIVNQ